MKGRNIVLFVCAFCMCIAKSKAQRLNADTIANIQYAVDFYKIKAAFNNLSYTLFDVQYRYKKSDHPNKILDSSTTGYKMHNGMLMGQMGNNQFLLNARYYISFNNEDSVITVSPVGNRNQTFQLDIFDTLFQRSNVMGLEKLRINDSLSSLKISFKPHSYYKNYIITYNKNFVIKKILLEYPDTDYDEEGNAPPTDRRSIMEILYTNYRSQNFDISIFNEENYVRKNERGKFEGVGAFAKFHIVSDN